MVASIGVTPKRWRTPTGPSDRIVWADEVRAALDLLPQLQREVIEFAYFEGYTQTEISAALDIPLGTVKTRTARGLQRLAGLLENPKGASR